MKKYLYIIICAGLAMVSCAKTEQDLPQKPEQPEVEQNTVPVTFKAVMENGAKTTIEIVGTAGIVSWDAGDAVKFIYEVDKTPGAVTSAALTDGDITDGTASFTADFPEGVAGTFTKTEAQFTGSSRHLYAVYPSSIEHDYSNASTLYVTVPSTQDGSFANAGISLAKWDKTNPTAALQFDNLCGLLQFTVSDAAVRSVVISSDATLAGKACVTFTAAGTDGKPTVKGAVQDPVTSITVNVSGAGTYYAAVLPTDLTNVYVSLYDADDNLIGDRLGNKAIPVVRSQIRGLGTLATGFSDRLYFTPAGQGTKDGSSWTNAGDVALLKTTMTSAVTKNLYLAAGSYNLGGASVKGTASSNIKMYGGFPASPSGNALSGRNVASNVTTITADDTIRPFYIQNSSANWLFDGISFLCTNYSGANGGAMNILLGSAILNHCTFDSCSNANGRHGVVRVESSASFTNCVFSNNTSTGNAGAIYVKAGASLSLESCTFSTNSANTSGGAIYVDGAATVNIKGCNFDKNSAVSYGGAVYVNGGTLTAYGTSFTENSSTGHGGTIETTDASDVKLNQCVFLDNTTSNAASDLYIGGTTNLYVNMCGFLQSTTSIVPATSSPHRILTGNNTLVGFNNCVIQGPYGKSNSLLQLNGKSVVVNSTIYAQISGACVIVGATDENGCRSINNIVINGSSSKYAFQANESRYIKLFNTIYSATTGDGLFPDINVKDNVGNKYYGVFPDNDAWTQKSLGSSATLSCGTSIKAYDWDGVCDGFTANSLANIKTLISGTTTVGSDFLTWLESDELKVNGKEALSVDIRGVSRNTSAMWPGSYEKASAAASAPAFNLR